MTALDIMVLLLVGWNAVRGISRGFTFEVLALIGWLLAIVSVRLFHAPVSDALAGAVGTPGGAAVLAFAITFGVPFIAGKLIARSLGGRMKRSALGPTDRILGLGFGALKGLIIAAFAFLLVTLLYDVIYTRAAPRPDWMTESRTYPLLDGSARALSDLIDRRRNAGAEENATDPVR